MLRIFNFYYEYLFTSDKICLIRGTLIVFSSEKCPAAALVLEADATPHCLHVNFSYQTSELSMVETECTSGLRRNKQSLV